MMPRRSSTRAQSLVDYALLMATLLVIITFFSLTFGGNLLDAMNLFISNII